LKLVDISRKRNGIYEENIQIDSENTIEVFKTKMNLRSVPNCIYLYKGRGVYLLAHCHIV
jgi:hypothetical protein